MNGELVVPVRQSNFRQNGNAPLTGDMFNICERIKEINPNLYIWPLEPPVQLGDRTFNYSIAEVCLDRVERLVMRVEHLDARILEHMQYLLKVPFEQRFAEAEALTDKFEADFKENELDKLYETLGAPMFKQMEHDGFITHRGPSYAKRGVRPR
jgi:hypothetical protein